MPGLVTLPAARPDPFAFANRDALLSLVDSIEKIKVQRKQRQQTQRLLTLMARTAQTGQPITPGEIAEALKIEPTVAPGAKAPSFFERILQSFDPRAPSLATTPLEQIFTGRLIERAMPDIATEARARYYEHMGREGRIGTLPGWWPYATEEQKRNYLNRVGSPLTVNVAAPFAPNRLKDYSDAMDSVIKNAKRFRPGGYNYSKQNLLKAWNEFKGGHGYDVMDSNLKAQLWSMWQQRITKLGNEAEFDATEPEWIDAAGLGQTAAAFKRTPEPYRRPSTQTGQPYILPDGRNIGTVGADGWILLNDEGLNHLLHELARGDKEQARKLAQGYGYRIPP